MCREHSDGLRSGRTEKIVLLTYSLTASHCYTEAHLAGVSFPRSFDSRLALRQSCSARQGQGQGFFICHIINYTGYN